MSVAEHLSREGGGAVHAQARLRPVRDQILATVVTERMTAGGLFIPETAEDRPRLAKVIDVGPGARDNQGAIVPVSCKPGDTVVYRRFGGQNDIKVGDAAFVLLSDVDVLAVLEPLEAVS